MSLPRLSAILAVLTALIVVAPTASAQEVVIPSGMKISFYLGLKRDDAAAAKALRAVSDPASPSYRQFLHTATVRDRFGASNATRSAVRNWFTQRGFTVTFDRAGIVATITAPAATWERRFGALQALPHDDLRDLPGTLIIPAKRYAVPRALKRHVAEADWAYQTSRILLKSPTARAGEPTNSGTWVGGCPKAEKGVQNYSLGQIGAAYGLTMPTGPLTIGIVSYTEGITTRNLRAAEGCFGWPRGTLRVVKAPGQTRVAPTDATNDFSEPQLDAQVVRGLAPAATLVNYQGFAGPFYPPLLRVFGDAKRPAVVSISYGVCEQFVNRKIDQPLFDAYAVRLGLVGTTLLTASGDSGASCGVGRGVSWPASSPYLTTVGGTRLVVDASNRRLDEVAWNDYAWLSPSDAGGASGGGLSKLYAKPWWQTAPNAAGYEKRAVPDLAAHASRFPGFPVVLRDRNGKLTYSVNSGTSAATPVVAVQLALMNQRLAAAGQPRVGFASPFLYTLPESAFRDIVAGDNSVPTDPQSDSKPVKGFQATPGYDLVTGLGVLEPGAG
jgi:subtilase family serine protease